MVPPVAASYSLANKVLDFVDVQPLSLGNN